ncbi:MAG: ATP-binding protein [Ruminococcus flavefaciens]|nr:ATP-binding protein [Ruminococcus flavefaciens]
MGSYLNPGNVLFQEALNSEIYVDKTGLIQYTNKHLNTENKFICVSRPRRFGKSMALKMLAAYYSKGCDSRMMFQNLKIASFTTEQDGEKQKKVFESALNQYDVLLLDIQGGLGSASQEDRTQKELEEFYHKLPAMSTAERQQSKHPLLTAMQRRVIRDIRENPEYAEYIAAEETSLGNALLAIYKHTGNKFVFLIDEWDSIFRNYEEDILLQDKYIDLLRDWFKNPELLSAYALVYMTGILPVKRYGTQSALNIFQEYTFLTPLKLAEFSGFTEEEVRNLCVQYDISFEEMSAWYNGYSFKRAGKIYNPRSVVAAIENEEFENYWTNTGTYLSVKKAIEMNFDGLKEDVIHLLGDGRCKVNTATFQNDMTIRNRDDALTFLIHLGYLAYDSEKKEVYIPNKEIRTEFVNAIQDSKWTRTFEAISHSEELLSATLSGDEQQVAECIEKVHEENTSILTYHYENDLSCVIVLAYYQARDDYQIIRELPTGKGFADIAFIPRTGTEKPAMLVELKWNQNVQAAIDQMKEKNYSEAFQDYFGEVLLVGINYDKKTKKHQCQIEKIIKQG